MVTNGAQRREKRGERLRGGKGGYESSHQKESLLLGLSPTARGEKESSLLKKGTRRFRQGKDAGKKEAGRCTDC